jgi:NAD(P)-dependent dehydrogenase (short-subunit alcohol dehydrogenase family)
VPRCCARPSNPQTPARPGAHDIDNAWSFIVTISLARKTLAVTGCFGPLGRAIGEALRAARAQVALIDNASGPAGLAGDVLTLPNVELGQVGDARRAMEQVVATFGGLDGLVNAAGGCTWETVEAGSVATWDRLYASNVRTALLASQAALPHLLARGGGRIVNVGAHAALHAGLGMGAYAAAKASVVRLTEAMAEEFDDRGITVNAVLPTMPASAAQGGDQLLADASRWASPEPLAHVVAFLLSEAASPITGALVPVRGRM